MLDFFHVYMYFLGQIDRDQICCNRYMMLYSSKPQHRESGLMCSGSMDDVDKTEHFLPETNNHPTLSIPHSGFCPLNGASIGPSLAALPFSAEAAFPYIVCNILRPAFRKGYSADHRLFVLGNRAVDQHRDSEGFPAWKAVHRPKGFYAGLSDKPILPPYPPKDPSPKGIDGYI